MSISIKYIQAVVINSILTLTVGSMLIACEGMNADSTEEVTLTLHLRMTDSKSDTTKTRSISTSTESVLSITQLKVLVFKIENGAETFAYQTPQITMNNNGYSVTLRKSQNGETYRLVIIANAGTNLPIVPVGTSKSNALKMMTFSSTSAWNATSDSNYSPIPLWGETASAKAISEGVTLDVVTLLRALARIDVGNALNSTGETASGLSNFTLKTVTLYRTRNKGYVAPINAGSITNNVVASVSIPSDAGTNTSLTYTCTDGKSLIRSIYVPETEQGTSKSNNVCLVIGGTYSNSLNYYRVDLSSNGNYIPLKRNCRYVVNITAVSNSGYTTEAAALTGDKSLIVGTNISAESWGTEATTTSGSITLP